MRPARGPLPGGPVEDEVVVPQVDELDRHGDDPNPELPGGVGVEKADEELVVGVGGGTGLAGDGGDVALEAVEAAWSARGGGPA